ncbi:putative NADPH dehydrogenase C23G7.10c [Chlamydiales bacterium STE3]|nr:putative NADPH dehydrogenase C23G7.10c [Chlamydiales bacterium STE3]
MPSTIAMDEGYDLLSPLSIRKCSLRNRIAVSPMCQYSARDGFAEDWHLVHLGSRAVGGAGLVFVEATAISAEGRISPSDLGIWSDDHVKPLARIADFVEAMGAVPAIQLAHAGRKGSCDSPWNGGASLSAERGGWEVVAPSPIPFFDKMPRELDVEEIKGVINAFIMAAKRALQAGFKIIEIHAAHGYLLHEFLSPISNQRKDEYGGSLENRMRLLCQVAEQLRFILPEGMPLFVRLSATDWVEGGWDIEQSIILAKRLKEIGVDLIDVSSGGMVKTAKIPVGHNYQVPFAEAIKNQASMLTGAVGLITEPTQANEIITSGQADLVFIAREFLREPYWAIKAQQTLNQNPSWPIQYGYAVQRQR